MPLAGTFILAVDDQTATIVATWPTKTLDGKARLWDVKTGNQIGPPLAHSGGIWRASFPADGSKILHNGGGFLTLSECPPAPVHSVIGIRWSVFSPAGLHSPDVLENQVACMGNLRGIMNSVKGHMPERDVLDGPLREVGQDDGSPI